MATNGHGSSGGPARDAPRRSRSWYDLQRYRVRLIRYTFTYAQWPDPAAAAGLVLGLLGVVTLLAGAVTAVVLLLGFAAAISILALLVILVLVVGWRRRSRPERVFAAAARSGLVDLLQGHMTEGMENDAAYLALERLYAPLVDDLDPTVGDHGWRLPTSSTGRRPLVLIRPAAPGQTLTTLLDTTLTPRSPAVSKRARRQSGERMEFMKALRRHLAGGVGPVRDDEEGDNLVLGGLRVDPSSGHLTLAVGLASYGEIMRTCDAALSEFALFAYLVSDRRERLGAFVGRCAAMLPVLRLGEPIDLHPRHVLSVLPWRLAAHGARPDLRELLVSPTRRAPGVGVAVTMVDGSDGVPRALVARRSSVVGTYPGATHVVPAGMCNAREDLRARGNLPADFLKWTVLGELLEECFDEAELSTYRTEDWVSLVREKLEGRRMAAQTPVLTGLALDLLTLRPEVCVAVEARPVGGAENPERLRLCWEYDANVAARRLELTTVDRLDRTRWVQSGIGSLVLADRSTRRGARSPEEEGADSTTG